MKNHTRWKLSGAVETLRVGDSFHGRINRWATKNPHFYSSLNVWEGATSSLVKSIIVDAISPPYYSPLKVSEGWTNY